MLGWLINRLASGRGAGYPGASSLSIDECPLMDVVHLHKAKKALKLSMFHIEVTARL
jgi:hypothetical protein